MKCTHKYKELNVEVADEALLLNEVEQKLRERLKSKSDERKVKGPRLGMYRQWSFTH